MGDPKRDRRATKKLPWGEWLTVFYGVLKHQGADLIFAGPRACDRCLIHATITAKGRDEHGGITVPSFIEACLSGLDPHESQGRTGKPRSRLDGTYLSG